MVVEGSPLTSPIMVNSTNLVFPVKHSGNNLVLESFVEYPKHVFKKNISHYMLEDMSVIIEKVIEEEEGTER